MMLRIPILAAGFRKGTQTMKAILTGVILAGLFAAVGCSQTSDKPAPTGPNGGDTGPGHMSGGQQHGPGHQGGRGDR